MQNAIQIGRVEMLDEVMMKAVIQVLPSQVTKGRLTETPTLFFEFSGAPSQVKEQIEKMSEITKKHRGGEFFFASDESEKEELWSARKEALWSAPSLKPNSEVIITDVCVPISALSKCISETKKDIEQTGLIAPLVGHVGDGNFHLFILVDPSNPEDVSRSELFNDRLVKRAISMDGTCTGEHGVGEGKMKYLPLELGPEAVELMRTIKKAIDPNNIMNPGKVVGEE